MSPAEAKAMLLSGRISYRRTWAMSGIPPKNDPPSRKAEIWIGEYDEEFNFAHMGAREVDDDWGKPKTKPKTPSSRKRLAAAVG